MRRFALCLGILLAWPLAGQAAKPAEPTSVEFGAGAWVDVDATGKAHVVKMDKLGRFKDEDKPGSLADIIKSRLRERIETWEFTPPTKNGVTVSGRTHVYMNVQAYGAESGGIGLRIESANTGMALRNRPSLMPLTDELGISSRWWIKVYLRADPDGHVVEARVQDSSLLHGKGAVKQVSPRLARAVREAFDGYEFDTESVDGQPIAGEGILPIVACSTASECSKMDAEIDGERRDANFAAADPAIRLRTAVAGTVL